MASDRRAGSTGPARPFGAAGDRISLPVRDHEVREAMDKLFEESLVPPALLAMDHKTFPVDLYEGTDVRSPTSSSRN